MSQLHAKQTFEEFSCTDSLCSLPSYSSIKLLERINGFSFNHQFFELLHQFSYNMFDTSLRLFQSQVWGVKEFLPSY